jgi:hypothetical protein
VRFTEAQEAAAAAVEDEWLSAGLATGAADRRAAEAGVVRAYRSAGLRPPQCIVWCRSPFAGAVAAAVAGDPSGDVRRALSDWASASGAFSDAADDHGQSPAGLVRLAAVAGGEPARQGWADGADPGASVRTALRTGPWAQARGAALSAFGPDGWAQLSAAAGRRGWRLLVDQLATRLRTRLDADLLLAAPATEPTEEERARAREARRGRRITRPPRRDTSASPTRWASAARGRLLDAVYGQHDVAWLATFAAAERLRLGAAGPARSWGRSEATEERPSPRGPAARASGASAVGVDLMGPLRGLTEVACAAGWWWPFERLAIITERPDTLERDNLGRLHHGDGAALGFPDGYRLFAWRGLPIAAGLADELTRLTPDRIAGERNAEVRRVMLEHFGYENYLQAAGARRVAEDETGVLWSVALSNDEPLVMVEVINSTAEPDGTFRRYWLRVPPTTRTAREGVAWTFGLTAEEYSPSAQT